MGGIWDAVCFEEKKKRSLVYRASLSLSLQAEAEENRQGDTSVEEADNWSKAGERFAPLNPGSLKGPRVHRVVSKVFHVRLPRSYRFVAHTSDRYNRTITTIHALTVFNTASYIIDDSAVTFHTWLNLCPTIADH